MVVLINREKRTIFVLCTIVLSFLFYKYLEKPQLEELKTISSKLKNGRAQISSIIDAKNNMENIKNSISHMEDVASSLPEGCITGDVLHNIENMVVMSGCTLDSIIYDGSEMQTVEKDIPFEQDISDGSDNDLKYCNIKCSFYGDYNGIINMLNAVENYKDKLVVESISISSRPENNNYFVILGINCYYINVNNQQT